MPSWQIALLLIAGLAFAGWQAFEILRDVGQVVAPDSHDEKMINDELGKDSPAADTARRRRFGSRKPWYDALTALAGLLSLGATLWILFK
jgi:hypothetical protein